MPKVTINDDSKYRALIQTALALKGYDITNCEICWYSKYEDDDKTVITAHIIPFKEVEAFDVKIEVE